MQKLIRNEACMFTKKLSQTSSCMYFSFIFLERITNTSFEEALKVFQHPFYQEI